MKKTLSTRLLSGVSALLLATAVLLPSSTSAGAVGETLETIDGNHSASKSTLLAGDKSSLKRSTIADTVYAYNDAYLLGVAADFNVFLQEDFTVTDSDTEGRAAVGGDIHVKVPSYSEIGSKYSIGKGWYDEKIPLSDITGDSTYATFFLGGNVKDGMLDDSNYSNGGDVYDQKELSTKKLVAQWGDLKKEAFNKRADGKIPEKDNQVIDQTQTYLSETDGVINFANTFDRIKKNSVYISQIKSTGKCVSEGDTLIFTYEETEENPSVIYFDVPASTFANASTVKFENIPKLNTPVVQAAGVGETWSYPYIVVNITGTNITDENAVSLADPNLNNGLKNTYIMDINITKNNTLGSESILYNIPNVEKVLIGNNFQGSILAPSADVTDWETENNACHHGHLSGALIAKSFEGATQFGYRPCRLPLEPINLYFNKQWQNCKPTDLPNKADFLKHITVQKTVGGVTSSLVEDVDYTITVDTTSNTEWKATVKIMNYNVNAKYKVLETKIDEFTAVKDSVELSASAKDAKALINKYVEKTTSSEGDKTEPSGSGDKTEPSGSGDKTEPSGSGDKTEPSGSGDKTEPSGSDDKTEPSGSDDKTEPSGSGDKTEPSGSDDKTEPEVTTPGSTPTPDVDSDDDDNKTTSTTTTTTTTTTPAGVDNDGDDNNKTTTTTTTANPSGVGDGGDNNDKDTGTGSDGDDNNPMTGIKLSALMLSAVSLAAAVATSKKKK